MWTCNTVDLRNWSRGRQLDATIPIVFDRGCVYFAKTFVRALMFSGRDIVSHT